MTELGPDARSILDAARDGDEPSDADRKRVHASLARRIGLGAAIVGTTTAAAGSAGGATIVAGMSSLTKAVVLIVGMVGMVGVLGGGTYVVRKLTSPTPTPTATTTTAPTTTANAPTPNPTPSPTAEAVSPTPTTEPAPTLAPTLAPVPAPALTLAPAPTLAAAPTPDPSAKNSAFDDELAAMQQAQAVLASDPTKALTLLDAQSKQFPNGAFAQERAGMRVVALCELGRSDARAQADAFLAAHPQSPMALRIRSACKIAD